MNYGPVEPSQLLSSGFWYGVIFALLAIPAFYYRGQRAVWVTWALFTAVHLAAWVFITMQGAPPGTMYRGVIIGYVVAVILLQVGLPLGAGAWVLPKIAPGAPVERRVVLQGLGVIFTVIVAMPVTWLLWGKVLPWLTERAGWLPSAAPVSIA